ncbi:MAG: T9SS type A sorting domain-containing protein [Flectobacillus sp.]|nr:T9SS type A sorting domain-containing protein [Flectobacillus sp.]
MKKLLYTFFLTLLICTVKAQTVSIDKIVSENSTNGSLCSNKAIYVYYKTTGTFNKDNNFTIQLQNTSISSSWQTVSTKDSSGILTFFIPASIISNSNYYTYTYINIKIVSSSPIRESNSTYSYTVNSPMIFQITGAYQDTINKYEFTTFTGTLTGSSPFSYVLSDSTTNRSINTTSLSDIVFYPEQSGNYTIKSISNMCGQGKGAGSATIKVNTNFVKITSQNYNYCIGDTIGLSISKFGSWSRDSKFSIRFLSNDIPALTYDVSATEVNGLLQGIIPSSLVANKSYKVQVLTTNPTSTTLGKYDIYVNAKPSAEIVTSSGSINYGQSQELLIQFKGKSPFSAVLSDGSKIPLLSGSYSDSKTITVKPLSTTAYRVESYSTGCGINKLRDSQNKTIIEVKDGILTDSVQTGNFCPGSTVTVKYKSSQKLSIGSKINIRLSSYPSLYSTYYVNTIGTVKNDQLIEFKTPTSDRNLLWYAKLYTDDIAQGTYSPNALKVLNTPTVENVSSASYTYDNPTNSTIYFSLSGGEPYTVTMYDGSKVEVNADNESFYSNLNYTIYVRNKTTVYATSVSNQCGTTKYTTKSSTLSVTNVPTNKLDISTSTFSYEGAICAGKTVTINVNPTGTFENTNEYNVELLAYNTDTKGIALGTFQGNSFDVILPNLNSTQNYLRVSSTKPFVYSNLIPLTILTKPSAYLYGYSASSSGYLLAGDNFTMNLSLSGARPIDITYLDGSTFSFIKEGESNFKFIAKENVSYGIKSVSNQCGLGTINNNSVKAFTAKAYNIINDITYSGSNVVCQEGSIAIPFHLVGNIPNNTTFSVQIAKSTDTLFSNVKTGIITSPTFIQLPISYKAGNYQLRIISSDGREKSNISTFKVQELPKPVFTTDGQYTYGNVNAGNPVSLYITTNNASGLFTNIIKAPNFKRVLSGENSTSLFTSVTPLENTTYTLAQSTNECGTIDSKQQVVITVTPTISITPSTYKLCSTNTPLGLTINTQGSFGTDNNFKIYLYTYGGTRKEVLSVNKAGYHTIPLGNTATKGAYTIQVESTNPVIKSLDYQIMVDGKLDLVLSGNVTINQNEVAMLSINNKNNNEPIVTDLSSPITFKFADSTSLSQTLSYYNYKSYINAWQTSSKTYTLVSVTNACGTSPASGTARVTVNPISSKTVSIDKTFSKSLCAGATTSFAFTTKGTFSPNNQFKVQLSDKNGENFSDLVSSGSTTSSPIIAMIPSKTEVGGNYMVRVVSSDLDATSTTNGLPVSVINAPNVRFENATYYFNNGKTVNLMVKLTGKSPYSFKMGNDELNARTYSTSDSIYTLAVSPLSSISYRLFDVADANCSSGLVTNPSIVKLELITATEELNDLGVKLYPNPTQDHINIDFDGMNIAFKLVNFTGQTVMNGILNQANKSIDISSLPKGHYFIYLEKDGRDSTFKVIKY